MTHVLKAISAICHRLTAAGAPTETLQSQAFREHLSRQSMMRLCGYAGPCVLPNSRNTSSAGSTGRLPDGFHAYSGWHSHSFNGSQSHAKSRRMPRLPRHVAPVSTPSRSSSTSADMLLPANIAPDTMTTTLPSSSSRLDTHDGASNNNGHPLRPNGLLNGTASAVRRPSRDSLEHLPAKLNSHQLAEDGVQNIRQLRHKYLHTFGGQRDRMQRYLETTAGLQETRAVDSVLTVLDFLAKQDGHDSVHTSTRKVTVSVEGNISAGKSTFLRVITSSSQLQEDLQVVPEPVAKWQDVQGFNLLDEFYKDPKGKAFIFQNFVFLTRAMQERDSYSHPAPFRILERSIFSDRLIFVRAMVASKSMEALEVEVYDSWFEPMVKALPTLVPDAFIYLRAAPETCHNRMKQRARSEESAVPLVYLQELHANHEDWLAHGLKGVEWDEEVTGPVQPWGLHDPTQVDGHNGHGSSSSSSSSSSSNGIISGGGTSVGSGVPEPRVRLPRGVKIPQELRDSLHFIDRSKPLTLLDSSRSHALHFLHQVPTLVIDCNGHVAHVEQDERHQHEVAQQVKSFMDFVRELHAHAAHSTPPPQPNGLWTRDHDGAYVYVPKVKQVAGLCGP